MGLSFDPNWKNEKDHCDSSLFVRVHGMVGASPEATVREFKNCCITIAMDGSDMLLNDSEEAGSYSRVVRVDTLQTLLVERLTPDGKSRWTLIYVVH